MSLSSVLVLNARGNKTVEPIAEAVKVVLLSCISDRICDQTVNGVQLIEVPKIFGQNSERSSQMSP